LSQALIRLLHTVSGHLNACASLTIYAEALFLFGAVSSVYHFFSNFFSFFRQKIEEILGFYFLTFWVKFDYFLSFFCEKIAIFYITNLKRTTLIAAVQEFTRV
jgi:hypothetical protein